jgi:hypothetical protein
MLRIFSPEKIRRLQPGLNPWTQVLEASMLTTRPPKSLMVCHTPPSLLSLSPSIYSHCEWRISFCSDFYPTKPRKRISFLQITDSLLNYYHSLTKSYGSYSLCSGPSRIFMLYIRISWHFYDIPVVTMVVMVTVLNCYQQFRKQLHPNLPFCTIN